MTKSKKYVRRISKRSKKNKINRKTQKGGAFGLSYIPVMSSWKPLTSTEFKKNDCYTALNDFHNSTFNYKKCNKILKDIFQNENKQKAEEIKTNLRLKTVVDINKYRDRYCTETDKNKDFCEVVDAYYYKNILQNIFPEIYFKNFKVNPNLNNTEFTFDRLTTVESMIKVGLKDIEVNNYELNKNILSNINITDYYDIYDNITNILFNQIMILIAQDYLRSSGIRKKIPDLTEDEFIKYLFMNSANYADAIKQKIIIIQTNELNNTTSDIQVKGKNLFLLNLKDYINIIINLKVNLYDILLCLYITFKAPDNNCGYLTKILKEIFFNCRPIKSTTIINIVDNTITKQHDSNCTLQDDNIDTNKDVIIGIITSISTYNLLNLNINEKYIYKIFNTIKHKEQTHNIFDDIILSNIKKILPTEVDKILPTIFDLPSSILLTKDEESKTDDGGLRQDSINEPEYFSNKNELAVPVVVNTPAPKKGWFSRLMGRGGNKSKKRTKKRKPKKRTKKRRH